MRLLRTTSSDNLKMQIPYFYPSSSVDVEIKYCKGNCRSATSYLHDPPYYTSVCQCCRASNVEKKIITLDCGNNLKKAIAKDSVLKCHCDMCDTKRK